MSSLTSAAAPLPVPLTQQIRFCQAPDGVRIAYAMHGSGVPLVISTCWLSHLQHDWESPVWRHFLEFLGSIATVVRFDERGFGLSERDVEDFGLDARIGDLEAVVDAVGFERFTLMAMAQGGPVAISYAHRHPERVDRLVFYGSYAATDDGSPEFAEENRFFNDMIRVGWARPETPFCRVFSSLMIPRGGEREKSWLDDLQRVAVDAETLVRARLQRQETDCRTLLPDLDAPALVLHSRHDQMNAFDDAVALAAGLPDARFVPLESDNHIVLEDEPAWQRFRDELSAFHPRPGAPTHAAPPDDAVASLSPRERDVLALASDGLDNDAIAAELVLSVRTVERHLQNVYAKLGVGGKSARAAAVGRWLTS